MPLIPDIVPSANQSQVYVCKEDEWASLTGGQHQEVVRKRGALIVCPEPFKQDNKTYEFNAEGMERHTNLYRNAYIQS